MPTVTVPLNLTKPTVGGDKDVWGQYWNDNADKLNAIHTNDGSGTSVGMHVGTGKVLNVEGQLQVADSTDVTRRCTFTADLIPTATTINLAIPTVGGVIATVGGVHPTGTLLSGYYGSSPPTGYVFVDGRTIGDASSAATNRANVDCLRLFTHLWSLGFAVVGGRGASAAVDWAAHKQLVLPDHSGRVMAGRDNLSGTARGVLSGFTTGAMTVGAQTHTLAGGEMPYHAHAMANHVHTFPGWGSPVFITAGAATNYIGYATGTPGGGQLGYDAGPGGMTAAADTGGAGSGGAHNNIQPTIAVDVVMAL